MSADKSGNVTQLHRRDQSKAAAESILPFHLISLESVVTATDLSKSKIAELLNPECPRYDATFPKPRRVGVRSLRWRTDELVAWMSSLPVVESSNLPTNSN